MMIFGNGLLLGLPMGYSGDTYGNRYSGVLPVYLKSFECDLVGFHGDMMVMQATIWDYKQQDGDLMGI